MDPVLQPGAMTHEVQAPAGPFAFGAHTRCRQPDRRYQITARQLGQHPGVDAVGLAGQRGQTLDSLSVSDQHVPAGELELIVDEPGTVHRLDHRPHQHPRPVQLVRQPSQTRTIRRCPQLLSLRAAVIENADIHTQPAQIEPNVHHVHQGLLRIGMRTTQSGPPGEAPLPLEDSLGSLVHPDVVRSP